MIAPLIGRNGGRWECVDCDTWARHGVDVGEADDTLFTQLAKQVTTVYSALVANNSLDV